MGAPWLQLVRDDWPEPAETPPAVDLMKAWKAYMAAARHSPASVSTRLRCLGGLISSAGVGDPLDLTRDHVVAWLGRGVKPWTRVTYWKAVRAWETWVVDFGHAPAAVLLVGVPKPKTPQAVARPITDEVITRLLGMRLTPRPHAYVRLALFQALRVHEIAKLRAEDFDMTSGWLMVTGKGGLTKPIPIHQKVARLAADTPELGYWFPSHSPTGHVSATTVSRTITTALERCGSTATAHQLRDTAATRMQRTVKDIRLTQAMLRHTNITSTMKYTEASNAELQKATKALDWQDAAQAAQGPVLPSLDGLSEDQMRELQARLSLAMGSDGR